MMSMVVMGDVVMSLVFVMFGEKRRAFVRDKETENATSARSRVSWKVAVSIE